MKKENYDVITLENVWLECFFFDSAKNVYFFKWIAYSVTVAKKKGNKNASNNHRVLISGVDM